MSATEPATLSLVEAAELLGIGKTMAYDLARSGEFPVPVLKVGTRRKVSRRALMAFIDPEAVAS